MMLKYDVMLFTVAFLTRSSKEDCSDFLFFKIKKNFILQSNTIKENTEIG